MSKREYGGTLFKRKYGGDLSRGNVCVELSKGMSREECLGGISGGTVSSRHVVSHAEL